MNRRLPETSTPQTCTYCQAGQMHLESMTYFTWLADELITVPNFPAWVCDVCGRRAYDDHAVMQLNLLLNPQAGHPTRARSRPRPQIRRRPKSNPPSPVN